MVNFTGSGCVFVYYAVGRARKTIVRAKLFAKLFYQGGFTGTHIGVKRKHLTAFGKLQYCTGYFR